jgi:hypothetical protein
MRKTELYLLSLSLTILSLSPSVFSSQWRDESRMRLWARWRWRSSGGGLGACGGGRAMAATGSGRAVAATGGGRRAVGTDGDQAARQVPTGSPDLERHGSTPLRPDPERRGSTGGQT